MTDADTLVSAIASVSLGLFPVLVSIVVSLVEPGQTVVIDPAHAEGLESSRRVLALSEECARKVDQIEVSLDTGKRGERAMRQSFSMELPITSSTED